MKTKQISNRQILKTAKDIIKNKKIDVKYVSPKNMYSYIGMNSYAANDMGFPVIPQNVILVDKTLTPKMKKRTIQHEVIEREIMKKRKLHYWPAHKIASKLETK